MTEVKLSSKNQIVLPREARKALKLKAGDRLMVVTFEDRVIILERPKKHHTTIRGLYSKGYPADYLNQERQSWE